MVHHTHMDIGYTDQPLEVLDQQLGFLDLAARYCEEMPDFFWTIESAYLLKDYIRNRPPEMVEKVFSLLRSGRMELMALEVQPLTDLFSGAGLLDSVTYAKKLAKKHGFKVKCAMLDDIGGWAGGFPSALSKGKVPYLVAGVGSFQVFLPWADLPHLFYHKSPDGNRVLVWNLGANRSCRPQEAKELLAVYGLGANKIILPYLDYFKLGRDRKVEFEGIAAQPQLQPDLVYQEFEARLEAEKYPYDEVLLQYGGDNRWPSHFLPELIAKINQQEKLPPVELTTPVRFFEFMEEKYGKTIPQLKGVLTDPWVYRVGPAPAPLKTFRDAQRVYGEAEFMSKISGNSSADDLLSRAKENIALYVDHTCGISGWHCPELGIATHPAWAPEFTPLQKSWKTKAYYANAALSDATLALRMIEQRNSQGFAGNTIVVRNGSTQEQSGVVELYLGRDVPQLVELETVSGENVEFQAIEHNCYLVHVKNVPAKGALLLKVKSDSNNDWFEKTPKVLTAMPARLSNKYFDVEFNRNTGKIMKLSSSDGRKRYDDPKSKHGLFEPILQHPENYQLSWSAAGMEILKTSSFPEPEYTRCGILWSGKIADCVERHGIFPDGINFRLRIIFYHHQPQIDVRLFVDKPATRKLESLYLSAPFASKVEHWCLDGNIGQVDPQDDLLPGAMRDMFYVNEYARVSTRDFQVTMYSPDVPVLHPGGINLCKWLETRDFTAEGAHFYWHIYHNMLITDCPAWQEFHEEFTFSAVFDSESRPSALRACWYGTDLVDAWADNEFECPRDVRLLGLKDRGRTLVAMLENLTGELLNTRVRHGKTAYQVKFKPHQIVELPLR